MKANEFVKKFGIERAKQIVNADDSVHALVFATTGVSFLELKRLVESYELVKEHGSLGRAKEYADSAYTAPEVAERLHAAIADVESCMEGL